MDTPQVPRGAIDAGRNGPCTAREVRAHFKVPSGRWNLPCSLATRTHHAARASEPGLRSCALARAGCAHPSSLPLTDFSPQSLGEQKSKAQHFFTMASRTSPDLQRERSARGREKRRLFRRKSCFVEKRKNALPARRHDCGTIFQIVRSADAAGHRIRWRPGRHSPRSGGSRYGKRLAWRDFRLLGKFLVEIGHCPA